MPGMLNSVFVWFGLVPLFFAIEGLNWRRAGLWSWYFGTVYIGIAMYWLPSTLTVNISAFNGFPPFLGFVAFLLMILIEGFFFFIFGSANSLLDGMKTGRPILRGLSLSAVYLLTEFLRGTGDIGFTGARLSNALYNQLATVQAVSLVGTLGLTFLIVLFNYALYRAVKDKRTGSVAILLSVMAFSYVLSYFAPVFLPSGKIGKGTKIGVVQSNVTVAQRYRMSVSSVAKQVTSDIDDLSKSATLIFFPEGTFEYDFTNVPSAYDEVLSALKMRGSRAVIGYPSMKVDKIYNSAGLFVPKGLEGVYSKHILVPFTETLPYPQIFGLFHFLKLLRFFTPGKNFTVFDVNGTKFSVQICFESYFGWLSRKFVNEGARFLVTITNDSWFNYKTALEQHFAQTVFRAVENRKWAVQVADTGMTGVVDPYGRIVKKLPIRSKINGTFSVYQNDVRTVYDLFGNLIPWIALFLVGLEVFAGLLKNTRQRKE